MYSFVQRHYWHNGLFAYYQVKHIPHFFIALCFIPSNTQGTRAASQARRNDGMYISVESLPFL